MHKTHCIHFRFEGPPASVDPIQWGQFVEGLPDSETSCDGHEIRTFVEQTFDCPRCREKMLMASTGIDNVSFVTEEERSPECPPRGHESIERAFEKYRDPTSWMPISTANLTVFDEHDGLAQTVTRILAIELHEPESIARQNRLLGEMPWYVTGTLYCATAIASVHVFDSHTCFFLDFLWKQTDLLLNLLLSQQQRARAKIAEIVGTADVKNAPHLTDVNTPYFARWSADNDVDTVLKVRSVLFENNRARLKFLLAWITSTKTIAEMPDFVLSTHMWREKWRLFDSEDFTVMTEKFPVRNVMIASFELVLGALVADSELVRKEGVPTVLEHANVFDCCVGNMLTAGTAGFNGLRADLTAAMVPPGFPMVPKIRAELDTFLKAKGIVWTAADQELQRNLTSFAKSNDSALTRPKLRFFHMQNMWRHVVVLRQVATLTRFVHEFAHVLADVVCGDLVRCFSDVIRCIQYQRLADRFGDYVTERLADELGEEPPPTTTTKKSKKKKKTRSVPAAPAGTESAAPESAAPDAPAPVHESEDEPEPPSSSSDDWELVTHRRGRTRTILQRRPARVPQQPARVPDVPEEPARVPDVPAVPEEPARVPDVPEELARVPDVPEEPARVPDVPEEPARVPDVPEEPARVPDVPEEPARVPDVPPVPQRPADVQEVLPVRPTKRASKRHRNKHKGTVMAHPPIDYLPRFVGIPGYDPSTYYMMTDPMAPPAWENSSTQTVIPMAMYAPDGTVLYGHFAPSQLVCLPVRHF